MQGRNLPWAAGLATFLVVALLFLFISQQPGASAVLGGVAGFIAFGAVKLAFPSSAELDAYNVKARRGVDRVLKSVKDIQSMAKQVKDPAAKAALEEGCRRIPDLIASVQRREPGQVASMAAKLNVTTSGVRNMLTQYVQIQKDPDLYDSAAELMTSGQRGFQNFNKFVVNTFRQLNEAQVMDYKATLAALEPLQLPQLT